MGLKGLFGIADLFGVLGVHAIVIEDHRSLCRSSRDRRAGREGLDILSHEASAHDQRRAFQRSERSAALLS
jgi:hypothetical protein